MKTLTRVATAFALAAAVFMSGCGPSEEEKKLSETRSQSQALATEATKTTEALVAELQKLKQENRALQMAVNEAVTRQEVVISRIEAEASKLSATAGTVQDTIAKQVEAEKKAGSGFLTILLWLVIAAAAIGLVWFLLKAFKPKPFEDEDEDDFSSFDDDDFGFDEDDEFGDEDGGDKKKDAKKGDQA